MKTLAPHLFVSSCDGALFDTRKPDWSATPLRVNYCHTFRSIETTAQLKATLRAGGYAWPGGYPLFFIMEDSEAMCFTCARKEFKRIASEMYVPYETGWRITACEINWEDNNLHCCHCNNTIESAYHE